MYFQKQHAWSVFIFMLAFTASANAADITGTWALQDVQVAGKVILSLHATDGARGNFQSSSAFDLAQIQGLTPAQMASPMGTIVRFEIVREAGNFVCEGYFKAGNGAGTFVFKPNPGFVPQMASFGFADVPEDKLFSMAVHNIGPRFAAEIQAAGVRVTTVSQLVAMSIHGVTSDFIRRIRQAGFNPGAEDLVKMRIHGVTPEFAADVKAMYNSATIEDLVRLRIHGITMDYIRAMQGATSIKVVSLEQIVRVKIHGIN